MHTVRARDSMSRSGRAQDSGVGDKEIRERCAAAQDADDDEGTNPREAEKGEGAKRTVAAVEEDAADAVLLAAAQVEHLPPHRLEV